MDDAAWRAPSRCAGWSARDLLYHQLLDAQRALRTLALPSGGTPDVDFITYWHDYDVHQNAADAAAHAEFVRRAAGAYPSTNWLSFLWDETSRAASNAARACDLDARVTTQGHVLTVADFIATLTTEAAIHHLDFIPGSRAPNSLAPSLALAARTLDGLLGQQRPLPWSDEDYLLRGTGRVALSDAERAQAGNLAARFPVIT